MKCNCRRSNESVTRFLMSVKLDKSLQKMTSNIFQKKDFLLGKNSFKRRLNLIATPYKYILILTIVITSSLRFEHKRHTTLPHRLQWWRLVNTVNSRLQSEHDGAWKMKTITGGKRKKHYRVFLRIIVIRS